MKKVYWRPRAVSRNALVLIGLLSIGALFLVENLRTETKKPYYEQKLEAAQLAAQALEAVKLERLRRDILIDWEVDPSYSGLIGQAMTAMTSSAGTLTAKQTTVNPNFAAVIVDMLKSAGVKEGDVVAVGCSGSFPAMNICVYAALETLKVKPVIVTSATASQWGANHPDFLWIDMEKYLHDEKIFSFCSVATSIGGHKDLGVGLPDEARTLAEAAIERNNLTLIQGETFKRSVDQRMKVYREHTKGAPIKAFINVGGAMVSTGRITGKRTFRPGLNLRAPAGLRDLDGAMPRFAKNKVPAIHLNSMTELAERYGLPIAPKEMPVVGEGDVFIGMEYSRTLAIGMLVVIFASLYTFIRSSIGFRLLRKNGGSDRAAAFEPMV